MIRIQDLRFAYPKGDFEIRLDALHVAKGEGLCITGPSGSGKTTLIQLVSGILKPTSGSVRVGDLEVASQNEGALRRFRLRSMGFIFQDFELMEYLTVEHNILLPYYLDRSMTLTGEVRGRLDELLNRTGLQGKRRDHPINLSHGEKQRVAVCRALITLPALVIGDEPTANLDRDNADAIMELILELVKEQGATYLLVTHDPAYASRFENRLDLS